MTSVFIPEFNVNEKVEIEVEFPACDKKLISGKKKQFNSIIKFMKFLAKNSWDSSKYSNNMIVYSAQTGHRITLKPETIVDELNGFDKGLPEILAMIKKAALESPKYKPFYDLVAE